jgi:hypothetical protein
MFGFGMQVNAKEIDLKTSIVNKIENTNLILLKLDVLNIDLAEIKYWKIKGFCEEGVDVYFKDFIDYECNKYAKIDFSNSKSLVFLLNNKDKVNKFNLKLKAYNKEGKRIYNQNKLFLW